MLVRKLATGCATSALALKQFSTSWPGLLLDCHRCRGRPIYRTPSIFCHIHTLGSPSIAARDSQREVQVLVADFRVMT